MAMNHSVSLLNAGTNHIRKRHGQNHGYEADRPVIAFEFLVHFKPQRQKFKQKKQHKKKNKHKTNTQNKQITPAPTHNRTNRKTSKQRHLSPSPAIKMQRYPRPISPHAWKGYTKKKKKKNKQKIKRTYFSQHK